MVNPNRLDDLSGLGHLAAVGLVFMTMVAVNRELRSARFWTQTRRSRTCSAALDLVALGTVADVVPLKGLNRAFVAKGLIALRRREHVGLTALMDVARLTGPPEPGISASCSGRASMPAAASAAPISASTVAAHDDPTKPRASPPNSTGSTANARCIEQPTLAEAEAEAMAALGIEEKGAVVVTAAAKAGIRASSACVAARLKERFGRPAFAIALEPGGIGTGSGRSIAGVDLGRAVRPAVADGLLLKGGGHAMAAGVTFARTRLRRFAPISKTRWRRGRGRAPRRCAPD